MVSARSFAMGMNRFLDRKIDIANPRTANRMIPAGKISPNQCLAWSVTNAIIFILAAFSLSKLAGYLAIPLLLILMSYSLFKKFSWTTHYYLGLCLGLAPVAVQIALTGTVTLPIVLLGAAIMFWTAGFDILYSLQDIDFDKLKKLYSIPAKFGPKVSLTISRLSFTVMISLLILLGVTSKAGLIYYLGLTAISGVLVYEQWLVRDAKTNGQSKNINAAFFTSNAWVSVVFFCFSLLDNLRG